MDIVERGQLPEDKEAQWTCKKCKSVIRAKASEGKFTSDQRDGDAVVFNCPVCQEVNWIDMRNFK